jgi:hypothetical protein
MELLAGSKAGGTDDMAFLYRDSTDGARFVSSRVAGFVPDNRTERGPRKAQVGKEAINL